MRGSEDYRQTRIQNNTTNIGHDAAHSGNDAPSTLASASAWSFSCGRVMWHAMLSTYSVLPITRKTSGIQLCAQPCRRRMDSHDLPQHNSREPTHAANLRCTRGMQLKRNAAQSNRHDECVEHMPRHAQLRRSPWPMYATMRELRTTSTLSSDTRTCDRVR